jgi:SAM-dependent methyltransferase
MSDATERFSSRVDDYVKYRPSYPSALFDALERLAGLARRSVVADVGSGTGIASEILLERGYKVLGVEPNRAMREAAERALSRWSRVGGRDDFVSVSGRAEATGLEKESVDLVLAAQAFHWFERAACRCEFARILRPHGSVALVWNERSVNASPFLAAYEALLHEHSIDYEAVHAKDLTSDLELDAFFAPGGYTELGFTNSQDFDHDGLIGRARSSSYVPAAGHPSHGRFFAELDRLYDTYAVGGSVRFEYTTRLYLGRLAAA